MIEIGDHVFRMAYKLSTFDLIFVFHIRIYYNTKNNYFKFKFKLKNILFNKNGGRIRRR